MASEEHSEPAPWRPDYEYLKEAEQALLMSVAYHAARDAGFTDDEDDEENGGEA